MMQPKTLEDAMMAALTDRSRIAGGIEPAISPSAPTQFDESGLTGMLRAPANPSAYQISVPQGMDRDAGLEAKARDWFHRAGLPQGIVSGIVDAYCRKLCGEEIADPVQADRTAAELTRDWGEAYGRKIAGVQNLIARCGGAEELAQILADTGLGNDPWLIRTLATIAEMGASQGAEQ